MKVLTKPKTWEARQVTCQGSKESCGAVLEIEFGDLQRTRHEAVNDPREYQPAWDEIFVKCPECGKTIAILDVPPHLVQKIPDTRAGYLANYR